MSLSSTPRASPITLLPFMATPVPDTPAPPPPARPAKRDATILEAIQTSLLGPGAAHFSDVTLVSRDGARIPAVRALLAVRSPYFRARLFAAYRDARQRAVPLPHIAAHALRDIVQYAYTDSATLIEEALSAALHAVIPCTDSKKRPASRLQNSSEDVCAMPPLRVVSLIELIMAADYVDMPGLAEKAATAAKRLVRAAPTVACYVLEAVRRFSSVAVVAPSVAAAAKEVLRHEPKRCLMVRDFRADVRAVKRRRKSGSYVTAPALLDAGAEDAAVLVLAENTFMEVLKDRELFANESYLFQVLYFWATEGRSLHHLKETHTNKAHFNPCGKRWDQAKHLAHFINFDRMQASFLQDYVEPSGLVEPDVIWVAYRQIALQGERHDMLHNKFRTLSKWSTGSRTLAETKREYRSRVLNMPWIRGGIHEWTFRLNKESDCTFLGFTALPPNEKLFFGNSAGGWAFGMQGICTCAGKILERIAPRVREGSTVKLVLNLTGSGTMSIVVDDAPKSFVAFREMKQTASQFLPVVYLKAPASITLIDERHSFDYR